MYTPRLAINLCVQSIRTHSRVVLSPRSPGWLKGTLHRGRTLALFFVLSIMVVPVVACAPASSVPPLEPAPTPAPDPSPSPVLPTSDQGLRFERISIAQGLSHSTVNCILQDSKGFMWFGTNDGLNRYDGHGFTVYKHDPGDTYSLSHNRVQALFEDSTGTLWVGTYGGLNRFDRDSAPGAGAGQFARYDADDFQNATDSPEESRNVVVAIDEYPTGVPWYDLCLHACGGGGDSSGDAGITAAAKAGVDAGKGLLFQTVIAAQGCRLAQGDENVARDR
jgi:hypothetical protein